jgi:hypothetical protein
MENDLKVTDEEIRRCPNCDSAVDADGRFCKNCAFDLTGEQTSAKPVKRALLWQKGILVLGLLGLIIAIVISILYIRPTENVASNVTPTNTNTTTSLLGTKAKNVEAKILRGEELSWSDIDGISTNELRVLRNVSFARYGRKYERPGLGDYFFTTDWYKPNDQYSDSMLTAIDKANINLILSKEKPEITVASGTPYQTPVPTPAKGSDFSSLSEDDIRRIINEKGITTPGVTYMGDRKEVQRVGPYNEEGKYYPVEAIIYVTDRKKYLIKVRVFKDDFGDIVVKGALFGGYQ